MPPRMRSAGSASWWTRPMADADRAAIDLAPDAPADLVVVGAVSRA